MATRDEVYCKFGITAEAAQLFETELGTLLIGSLAQAEDLFKRRDADTAQQIHDEIVSYTLGRALKRLEKAVGIDDMAKAIFSKALLARNRLSHGFYLQHNFRISTDEGRDAMITDLDNLHQCLFEAWQIASAMSAAMLSFNCRFADSEKNL